MHNMQTVLKDEADGTPENVQLLEMYYDYFNELLFSGTLPGQLCPIELVLATENKWQERKRSVRASTIDHQKAFRKSLIAVQPTPETIKAPIIMYEILEDQMRDPVARLRSYLGSLLHEMIHAAQIVLPCKCASCFDAEFNRDGVTGHGRYWFLIAKKLIRVCESKLELTVTLGEKYAAVRELRRNPKITVQVFGEEDMGLDLAYLRGKVKNLAPIKEALGVDDKSGKLDPQSESNI